MELLGHPYGSVDLCELPCARFPFQYTRQTQGQFLVLALPFEPPLLPGVEPSHRIALLHVEVLCVDGEIPGTGDVVMVVLGSAPSPPSMYSPGSVPILTK